MVDFIVFALVLEFALIFLLGILFVSLLCSVSWALCHLLLLLLGCLVTSDTLRPHGPVLHHLLELA